MKLHRPTDPPPPRPLVWDREARYMVEPSQISWNDSQLRICMERALSFDRDSIARITKLLNEYHVQPLHSVRIAYPFVMPPTPYPQDGQLLQAEIENALLREFAFDTQDVLDEYYCGHQWQHWFVAPYVNDCDNPETTFHLGVFVDETFVTEVVE